MRAFSRDLGLSSTTLNAILNDHYGLSKSSAFKISEKLKLSDQETEYFVAMVEFKHAKSKVTRDRAEIRIHKLRNEVHFETTPNDISQVFTKWYHLTIVELITVHSGQLTVQQLAETLDLDTQSIEQALECLTASGLIKFEDGIWYRNHDFYTHSPKIPSTIIRSFHAQMIERAKKAIYEQKTEERFLLSTTFSFDSKTLKEAMQVLGKLHNNFIGSFQTSQKCDAVYGLNFQFFRLDKGAHQDV